MKKSLSGKAGLLAKETIWQSFLLGHPGNFVTDAQKILDEEGISIEHHDMRFAKPLDTKLLDELPKRFTQLITIEDGIVDGGMGSAIAEYYASLGVTMKITWLGVPRSVY